METKAGLKRPRRGEKNCTLVREHNERKDFIMKKTITTVLLALLALSAIISICPNGAQAANTVTVIVDGWAVDFPDAPAYIDENGRTQIPARYIGEALGAHMDWDESTGKVTISRRSLLWGESHFTCQRSIDLSQFRPIRLSHF